jgi:ketosteroid isomerase-like protein
VQEDEQIVRNLLAAVDSGDLTGAAELLSDEVCFQLGGSEPVVGPMAAAAAFGTLTQTVASMSHQIHQVWVVDAPEPAVICELTAKFEGHDGTELALPGVNVYRLRDGRIVDYRVYMDFSALVTT